MPLGIPGTPSLYKKVKEYNTINEFCFRVRERISDLMVKHEKDKVFQKIQIRKKELNNLIKNKNVSVCINATDKNIGACNANKIGVIKECDRFFIRTG